MDEQDYPVRSNMVHWEKPRNFFSSSSDKTATTALVVPSISLFAKKKLTGCGIYSNFKRDFKKNNNKKTLSVEVVKMDLQDFTV